MIQCKHCPNNTMVPEAGARHLGWRIFRGLSQTGKQLDDVVCPDCSGRGGVASGAVPLSPPSWNIECTVCEWVFLDEFDVLFDAPLVNALEAERYARIEHKCEPEFRFISPDGTEYSMWKRQEEFRALVEEARHAKERKS